MGRGGAEVGQGAVGGCVWGCAAGDCAGRAPPHGRPALRPRAGPLQVTPAAASLCAYILINSYYYMLFLSPLVEYTRSKQDRIKCGHGAQYLYRPLSARANLLMCCGFFKRSEARHLGLLTFKDNRAHVHRSAHLQDHCMVPVQKGCGQ